MEIIAEETSMETVSEEAVSKVVDLIIDIIHHHRSLDKRSTIYIGNLDTGQQSTPLISENKYIIYLINIFNIL
jgi:hypothetical protein